MSMKQFQVMEKFYMQLEKSLHLIGVSCGSGLTAKRVVQGGADMILALSSGRFRQMGLGSLAGFMPYANSNQLVMEFGTKEMIPKSHTIPIIFGLNACDPTIILKQYLEQIQIAGFSGINNYPTIGLIDGTFREALEEQGISYDTEVEAVRLAHSMNMFTLAFVFNEEQAEKMIHAGADVICVHLGLTTGGEIGAKRGLSLKSATVLANKIFKVCDELRKDIIKMVYGGSVNTPMDVEYIYNNSSAHGYIGGSTFDRTPFEKVIMEQTRDFKNTGIYEEDVYFNGMLLGIKKRDYVNYVKQYVYQHYMEEISFSDLADNLSISRSYLSSLFKKEIGVTFPSYLNDYRIHKACDLVKNERINLTQAAQAVGYQDYAHFNKTFKKVMGVTPSQYVKSDKSQ